MRCVFCGDEAAPDRPMITGAGVALCGACIQRVAAAALGEEVTDEPTRPGWKHGEIDLGALASVDVDDLRAEVERVEDIAAPFQYFLHTARIRLAHATGTLPPGHVHLDDVPMPDGSTIRAVSFAADAPYERERAPDFGVYLDERWSPPWPHEHIDWPDFATPADAAAAIAALERALERARSGEVVEVGCLGGHGRTGTALACMAVLAGASPRAAVAWVRENYCDRAVETLSQDEFVRGIVPR
jgi:hypothetical protein